jgi:preprotein translocase subunit SecG
MNWLQTATTILHVLLASAIVGLVLLQRGRGADAGAGFGAGASGTVFGARGSASFLSRSTAWLAALFIITSLVLAYLGSQRGEAPSSSVTDRVTLPSETPPATPPTLAPMQPAPAAPDAANSTPTPAEPAATDQAPPASGPQPPNQ